MDQVLPMLIMKRAESATIKTMPAGKKINYILLLISRFSPCCPVMNYLTNLYETSWQSSLLQYLTYCHDSLVSDHPATVPWYDPHGCVSWDCPLSTVSVGVIINWHSPECSTWIITIRQYEAQSRLMGKTPIKNTSRQLNTLYRF